MATTLSSVIVFAVSLLVGGAAIHVGAVFALKGRDYTHAVVTALIGAVVWAIVAFFVGWIPLLGPILVFLAYLWVINTRYPGGWINALLITLVAWVTLIVVLAIAEFFGAGLHAFGVPGA